MFVCCNFPIIEQFAGPVGRGWFGAPGAAWRGESLEDMLADILEADMVVGRSSRSRSPRRLPEEPSAAAAAARQAAQLPPHQDASAWDVDVDSECESSGPPGLVSSSSSSSSSSDSGSADSESDEVGPVGSSESDSEFGALTDGWGVAAVAPAAAEAVEPQEPCKDQQAVEPQEAQEPKRKDASADDQYWAEQFADPEAGDDSVERAPVPGPQLPPQAKFCLPDVVPGAVGDEQPPLWPSDVLWWIEPLWAFFAIIRRLRPRCRKLMCDVQCAGTLAEALVIRLMNIPAFVQSAADKKKLSQRWILQHFGSVIGHLYESNANLTAGGPCLRHRGTCGRPSGRADISSGGFPCQPFSNWRQKNKPGKGKRGAPSEHPLHDVVMQQFISYLK